MKKFFAQFVLFAISIVSMAQTQNIYEWKNGAITIKNSSEIDSITFSIPDELIGVATDSIIETTATTMTAIYSANFSVNSSSNVIEKGICYSTVNKTPTVNDSTQMFGYLGNKSWTSVLTGLKAKTSYYFRPFLKFNDKLFYGNVKTFTTAETGWISLGMGKMTDAFIYDDVTYFDVEIQQNEVSPNAYRIVNPYDQMLMDGGYIDGGAYKDGPSKYFEFKVMPAGTDYEGSILDKDYVIFSDVNTGYWNPSYEADVYAIHPYRLGMAIDLWNNNVVLDYQENGLPGEVSIAPYYYMFGVGGWNKTTSTSISVLFPGYVKRDYSVSVNYAGIFTANDGTVHAMADLVLGAGAMDVKAIVMPADADAAAVADAIAAGDLQAIDVEAGRIEVPFNAEELGGSKFQIIVAVMADGVAKNVASASFEYYGAGASPWQSLGVGYFTDDIVTPMFFDAPIPTYEVEIMESNETPGLYRIMNPYNKAVHPYGSVEGVPGFAPDGFFLEVDATDPEGVYIKQQSLGMDWGYGEMSFVTNGARYLATNPFETVKGAGYLGKLEDGVITFPVFKDTNQNKFQGVFYMGSSGYYAGSEGKIEIVLPNANASARKMPTPPTDAAILKVSRKEFLPIEVGQLQNNSRIFNKTIEFTD